MAPVRGFGRLLLLAAIVALAVTLRSADAFVAGGRGGLAWVVASFPPVRTLAVQFGAALGAAVAVVWGLSAWAGRRCGTGTAAGVARWSPLAWIGVAVVPFLPGAAGVLPGLLVFSGPILWLLLGAALLAGWWGVVGPAAFQRWSGWSPSPVTLWCAAFLVYAGLGLSMTNRHGVRGDEPHYLVIVESLLRDGDLQVENNYEAGDYRAFVPSGPLPPHSINRGLDGVMYSVHAPGLPLLIAPAYGLAGRAGATLVMAALGAAASLAVFLLAQSLVGPGPALVTWLAVSFSTPWLMHGWLIFPEMVAACIASWALWWLWQESRHTEEVGKTDRGARWLWRGLLIGTLPWFHAKFVVLCAGLAVVLGVAVWRRPGRLAAFAAPIAALIASWFFAFYLMYGVADPTMPYGGLGAIEDLAWANVPRGMLGLLFDQEFGLLLHAPVYLLLPFGVAPLLRGGRHRVLLVSAAAVGGAFLVSATRYYMWWGGLSVPARFLVPVLPFLAPVLAVAIAHLATQPRGRALVAVTLGMTLAASTVLVVDPGWTLLFNTRDGTGNLLTLIQGAGSWTRLFPSLWRSDWVAELPRVLVFTGGTGLAMLVVWRGSGPAGREADGTGNAEGRLAIAFMLAAVFAIAVLGRVLLNSGTRDAVTRDSQLRLLEAWEPGGWVDIARLRPVSGRALLQRLHVPLFSRDATTTVAPPEEPASWLGPFPLPAGVYEARVWWRAVPGDRRQGELRIGLADSDTVLTSVPATDVQPLVLRFEVARTATPSRVVIGVADAKLIDHIARVEMRPVDLATSESGARPARSLR